MDITCQVVWGSLQLAPIMGASQPSLRMEFTDYDFTPCACTHGRNAEF